MGIILSSKQLYMQKQNSTNNIELSNVLNNTCTTQSTQNVSITKLTEKSFNERVQMICKLTRLIALPLGKKQFIHKWACELYSDKLMQNKFLFECLNIIENIHLFVSHTKYVKKRLILDNLPSVISQELIKEFNKISNNIIAYRKSNLRCAYVYDDETTFIILFNNICKLLHNNNKIFPSFMKKVTIIDKKLTLNNYTIELSYWYKHKKIYVIVHTNTNIYKFVLTNKYIKYVLFRLFK